MIRKHLTAMPKFWIKALLITTTIYSSFSILCPFSIFATGSTTSFIHSHNQNDCFRRRKIHNIFSPGINNHLDHPDFCSRHHVNGLLPFHESKIFGLYHANKFTATTSFSTASTYTNAPEQSNAATKFTISTKKGRKRDAGINENFSIIDYFEIPKDGFLQNTIFQSMMSSKKEGQVNKEDENGNQSSRSKILDLTNNNVTLPVALICSISEEYPSLSRARKACRNGSILIHRGPLQIDPLTNETYFDPVRCKRGRVDDRIYPSDVIAKQVRVSGAFYPGLNYAKPPFELPVVYEDDHFAIVNKPAGVVTYQHRKSGQPNRFSVSGALPYALHPPSDGVSSILRKPAPVHRLDKPTSGLLLAAKTKPAMVALSWQFVERKIKKTYTAIVNGIPDEPVETKISTYQAYSLGVDVDLSKCEHNKEINGNNDSWQVIDSPVDGKHAITVWRAIQYAKSLKADQGYLTMVEVKPKTGRFHQIRRHMAWICGRPLVGDKTYDTASESALYFRQSGLFLCSNKVVLEHPFYNTEDGRSKWDKLIDDHNNDRIKNKYVENGVLRLSDDGNTVEVHASIELPLKFTNLMKWEEDRFERLSTKD